jgi:signal peptidase I
MALALVGGVICARLFDRVVIEGTSMTPTYRPGDRLLLMRRLRPLRPGDVVALDDPLGSGRRLVKRVFAIRGDGVELRGDNPAASTDSRTFGPIPLAHVSHVVVRRYATRDEP